MNNYIFLFDLDSAVCKQKILPFVAKKLGKERDFKELLDKAGIHCLPFEESFLEQVSLLKEFSISEINNLVNDIELQQNLIHFMQQHKERCYIITEALDIWIDKLIKRIGMESNVFCSKAVLDENKTFKKIDILDKNSVMAQIKAPIVSIGSGNNDAELIDGATVGIAYGGNGPVSTPVLECATHAIYKEETLCQFLERLL